MRAVWARIIAVAGLVVAAVILAWPIQDWVAHNMGRSCGSTFASMVRRDQTVTRPSEAFYTSPEEYNNEYVDRCRQDAGQRIPLVWVAVGVGAVGWLAVRPWNRKARKAAA